MTDVVVTGIGVVSPFGAGTDAFWRGMTGGESAAGSIADVDFEPFDVGTDVACRVEDLAVEDHGVSTHGIAGRFAEFAVVAAREAVDDADLSPDAWDATRVGTCVGTSVGGLAEAEEHIREVSDGGDLSPRALFQVLPYSGSGLVSMNFGTRGPSKAPSASCASGLYAVCEAVGDLRLGHADVMIAGAAEAGACRPVLAGVDATREHSQRNDDPAGASRPFDADRDGLVLGDGAAILVLETAEHAADRGVDPYAVASGIGMTSDPNMLSRPADAPGMTRAMDLAMDDAGVDAADVDAVVAHATSTEGGDEHEATAINNAFGGSPPPVTAPEGALGHAMGASGAFMATVSALAVSEGMLPPTRNYETPDPAIDLPVVTERTEMTVRHALCNSSGYGRPNASAVFGRV